jgi:hypothetical protein
VHASNCCLTLPNDDTRDIAPLVGRNANGDDFSPNHLRYQSDGNHACIPSCFCMLLYSCCCAVRKHFHPLNVRYLHTRVRRLTTNSSCITIRAHKCMSVGCKPCVCICMCLPTGRHFTEPMRVSMPALGHMFGPYYWCYYQHVSGQVHAICDVH